jgi:hypothetical protein
MDTKQFFCSRVERGASVCTEQCVDCLARQGIDEVESGTPGVCTEQCEDASAALLKPSKAADERAQIHADALETSKVVELPQQQSGPQLQGRITISLYADGNAQVDGPFDDRILYHGLLAIAADVERDMYSKRRAQAEAHARMLASETRWQKFKRLRRERQAKLDAERLAVKARKAAEQAAALAAGPVVDELSKSLVK